MELPSHREADDTGPDQHPATTPSWSVVLGIAIVAVLLAVIVILHLTGAIGPGAH
jgi:hypothetical protein